MLVKYFLVGYGANFGTVQEAGLKFFECHGKPTVSLELEESLHGPLRGLGKKDVAFFLAAEDGFEKERMVKLAQALVTHNSQADVTIGEIKEKLEDRKTFFKTIAGIFSRKK